MKRKDLENLKFDSSNDKLKRKKHAEHLSNFLLTNEDINVISINSKWGTGKTWFVWMWMNLLKDSSDFNEAIIPVYYNAWVNDDYDDAFTPLLSEMDSELFDKDETDENIEKFKKASKAVLKSGLISIVSNLVSGLTKGIINFEQFLEAWNEKDLYQETIEEFNTAKGARTDFIDSLEEIIKEKGKKVFVFVDELDRCRPTFALETLERIKHYFDVSGMHFILIVDSEQLSYSAKILYGAECDTTGYLRRFIDIEYSLPCPKGSSYYLDIMPSKNKTEFNKYVRNLSNAFSLSLRDYDKLAKWTKIYEPMCEGFVFVFPNYAIMRYIFAYCLLLKLKHPEVIEKFMHSESILEFKNYMNLPNATEVRSITFRTTNKNILKLFYYVIFDQNNIDVSTRVSFSEDEEKDIKNQHFKTSIRNGLNALNFLSNYS